jgi:CheY-like chemotaxis protein
MFPNIQCNGFEMAPANLNTLRREIWRLIELCPADSAIETKVSRHQDEFEMTLTVHYMGGEFVSRSRSKILSTAIEHGISKLYDQIRFWRQDRFESVSWLSSVTDYLPHNPNLTVSKAKKERVPRVLIVDDEISSIRIIESLLQKLGCETNSAMNGQDAVEKIVSQPYDLLILDWMMPDMTGGEALKRAEELNSNVPSLDYQWSALRLPVVTYSGFVSKRTDIPECKHFRFIDHWKKETPYAQLLYQTNQAVSKIRNEIRSKAI